LPIFQKQKVKNIFIEFLKNKNKKCRLARKPTVGPYAGRGRESSPRSLCGAGLCKVGRPALPSLSLVERSEGDLNVKGLGKTFEDRFKWVVGNENEAFF